MLTSQVHGIYKSVKEILGDNFGAVSLPTVKINGTDKQLKAFAGSKAIAVKDRKSVV